MPRRAFSLIETLIAMLVLSIALVGLAAVPVATTRMMVHGVEREKALSVAMTRLEEVEAVPLDASAPSWVNATSSDRGYLWNRSTAKVTGEDLWTVTVRVDWSGLKGNETLSISRDYGPLSAREVSMK